MQYPARYAVALALITILVDIGLARLAYGLLLPATRAELGGPYGAYGVVGAVNLGGYLAGTFAAPALMRRFGPGATLCVAQLAVGVLLAGSAFAYDVVALGVLRAAIGFASAVGIVAAIGISFEVVPAARRGAVSGLTWAGAGVALAVSAPLGAWSLEGAGRWRSATEFIAIASIISGLAALRVRVPAQMEEAGTGARFAWSELLRADRFLFLVIAYAAFGFAYIVYATFIVAAMYRNGFSHGTITLVWIAYGLAAASGSLLVGGVLGSSLGRFAMTLAMGSAAFGAALALIPGAAATFAGTLCVGLGFAAMPAVVSALIRERSSTVTSSGAFAAVTGIMAFGQICGPIGGGFVADAFGVNLVPLLSAVVYAIGAAAALIDAARVRTPTV